MASISSFTGNVPQNYETYLGPLFFEPYAIDLVERMRDKQYNAVLELACGTGRVTRYLINKVAADGKLYATDLNEAMLAIAKIGVADERIVWQAVDAQNLPYDNDSFDLVVCQYGVMFFPDKPKAFKEAYRVLKQGSIFLFNTWNSLQYNAAAGLARDVLCEIFPDDPPSFFDKGPYSFFNQEEIRQLLQDAGFANITIETVTKTGTAPSAEHVINGLIDGTPASAYLAERNVPVTEVKEKFRERLIHKYGEKDLHLPMQAFVCEAEKP